MILMLTVHLLPVVCDEMYTLPEKGVRVELETS